jgi:Ca-activated chloride channel family protein
MQQNRRQWFALIPMACAGAQQPPVEPAGETTPKFSMEVNLVSIGFTVRDRTGALVGKLEQGDFEVYEEGAKQEVRRFIREQETPLTVGLVLDRSPSQDQFEQENIYAAVTFFRRVLRAEDRAFVAAFGNKIKQVAALTGSKEELERALKEMKDRYGRAPWVGPTVARVGGSAVLDAVYWPVKEMLAGAEGRKAVIMIGDGRENASRLTLVDVVDQLQLNDVLFYGIDNGGEDSRSNRRLRNMMPVVAEESGGRVFTLEQTPLRQAFEEIERELRTLYTIAYTTSNRARDGRFRKVEVRPKDTRYQVRARTGYYAR